MQKRKYLTIGELAGKMGTTVRTLQYYDKEGILSPSAQSEGGRRLYSNKDMVKLHQVLSLKYLGFSLDQIRHMRLSLETPQEVATVLENQENLVAEQIQDLQKAFSALQALRSEVLQMEKVNFDKYADIITLLQTGNKNFWVLKLLDDTLSEHVAARFSEQPELGKKLIADYNAILDEAMTLKMNNEPFDSPKSDQLAEKWWNMIMGFTGGDMTLLPKLVEFNSSKAGWENETAQKQKEVDNYIGEALMHYLNKAEIIIPKWEE